MRVEVVARSVDDQTRAYAEYRVFSSLARFSHLVRRAVVALTPPDGGADVVCAVTLTGEFGTFAHVTAHGRHAYDAINKTAERLSEVLQTSDDDSSPRKAAGHRRGAR